ncbi:hypothetical protein AMATHDRAFT_63703 [Amanita thiersii Skay4041]|uniref:G-protein coupled receptors family 1 profile domain-containing protein n=1 Tax=Amanita thiersii Skay4041 TaxID=703135 RepID=A0A2A9NN10_9AGAR|nr:hypothetical protein AMATHDRAFT_63703 [Amanita thiersii Skay4041]
MDPLLRASILATFVEAMLYGLYFASFLHCLRWLFFEDKGWVFRKTHGRLIPFMTLLIFVFLTTDTIFIFMYPVLYFRGVAMQRLYLLEITPTIIEFLLALLTDSVLIYRCWVVYSRRWRLVIIPILAWLGGASTSTLVVYYFVQSSRSRLSVAEGREFRRVVGAFYLCTIIINIYCTCAIVYKIWSVTQRSSGSTLTHVPELRSTMRIVGESGFLYMLTSISLFIAWNLPQKYQQEYVETICSSINTPMIGIAFNLIWIRVARQRSVHGNDIDDH